MTQAQRDLIGRLDAASRMMRPTEPSIDRPQTQPEREREIQHGLADMMAEAAAALSALEREATDSKRLDWLHGRVVDTIYLDDGKIVDVHGKDLRAMIDIAMKRWPTSLADDDDDEKLAAAIVADQKRPSR